MPSAPAASRAVTTALRHRRSARRLTTGQQHDLKRAFQLAQAIGDDRGYQHFAGIHGLPLPMYCTHGSPLFLPWHRAYLYFFEKALQDRVPGVTLPWWDWTHDHRGGIPDLFEQGEGEDTNPLASSPIQPSGREPGAAAVTQRAPGAPGVLPTADQVERALDLRDFLDFNAAVEDIHNGVHVWVGGTMGRISMAAYDPLFWAHHTMIDRVWRLWQLRHAGSAPPAALRGRALPPFAMTVEQTLDSDALGYDYAASTAAVKGTR